MHQQVLQSSMSEIKLQVPAATPLTPPFSSTEAPENFRGFFALHEQRRRVRPNRSFANLGAAVLRPYN